MKSCSKCEQTKPIDEFYHRNGKPIAACKPCTVAQVIERENKDPNKKRARERKRKFGVTDTQYQQLLVEQQGGCAICGKPTGTKWKDTLRALCIDHDHETGLIRGLLCNGCNSGLGYFSDNPRFLGQAIEYVIERRGYDIRTVGSWSHHFRGEVPEG